MPRTVSTVLIQTFHSQARSTHRRDGSLRSLIRAGLLIGCAIAVSACGRAGPPIKPSQAAIAAAKEEKRPAPARPVANAQNPDKKFILDGLLD
ncbi:MAG: hypothetical protein AAGM04_07170 [Pseudomonadota bacterium]